MVEQPEFLPVSSGEMLELGIDQLDAIIVSGDAYVDHPSFGAALVGRVLWSAGYTAGIIPQPDWRSRDSFLALGAPRLFFGVTAGNVDSMVNAFTPGLKRRRRDVYSPGGAPMRPDRAVLVYADRLHSVFPGVPLVLGGIEASLRRFAHYDYWSDSVRQSVLADAPAHLLVYGMGEAPLLEVARRLSHGEDVGDIRDVRGTAFKTSLDEWRGARTDGWLNVPSFSQVSADKSVYAEAFRKHYQEQDPFAGQGVVQPHPKSVIWQNPPSRPLPSEELDRIYELPYTRRQHPSYTEIVPALEPVRFSITSHRGCFGSCHFCALVHHQGRIVQSRSPASLVREAAALTSIPGFRGVIQDLGGPTANMYGLACQLWSHSGCGRACHPGCPSLDLDHSRYMDLLRQVRQVKGVRHVFIGSGLRHDLIVRDGNAGRKFLEEACRYHISGHLKVAPEHVSQEVCACMNKPSRRYLDRFLEMFGEARRAAGKEEYVLPYLMSGHPGCTLGHMVELALYLRDNRIYPEQVQDFTPTPLTVSTTMYHTGLDPFTLQPVHVPKGREKRIQRAILGFRDPRNYPMVREGLRLAGRPELIGDGPGCLVPSGHRESSDWPAGDKLAKGKAAERSAGRKSRAVGGPDTRR
ncbi:MAG: hypothetical protein A4E47_01137 [Methanosaeta sp. PtaU1.Bin028]|nr:MAG: hypothetical protein A4E47_01137 [Methanosaeta sp. PtaU1.Bin028]